MMKKIIEEERKGEKRGEERRRERERETGRGKVEERKKNLECVRRTSMNW